MPNYVANAVANLVTAYRLRPVGSVQIAHDSLTPHPNALRVEDFTGVQTYAEWLADGRVGGDYELPGFFYDFSSTASDTAAGTFDATETFNGHRTLRIGEERNYAQFCCSVVGSADIWYRVMFRLDAGMAGSTQALTGPSLGGLSQNTTPFPKAIIGYDLSDEVFQITGMSAGTGTGSLTAAYPFASLQDRWVSGILYCTQSSGNARSVLLVDGEVLIDRVRTDKALTLWAINADFDILSIVGQGDPINHFMNIGLYEYVIGDDPYGLKSLIP